MLKFAMQNLMSRKLRSLLALLGLSVAIMGMVGLFSVARGIDRMVDQTFSRIPGLVVMQLGAPMPLFSRVPTGWEKEIEALDGVSVANPEIWTRVNVIDGKMIVSPPRFYFGTEIESRLRLKPGQAVYRDDLQQGRFLAVEDRGTLNAVVSRQIADEFHKTVGDTLRVNGEEVTIVGIYHCGSLLLDVAIIVDIDRLREIARFDTGTISSIYVEPDGTVNHAELQRQIGDVFRRHDFKLEAWRPSSALGETLPKTGSFVGDLVAVVAQHLSIEAGANRKPPQPSRQSSASAQSPGLTNATTDQTVSTLPSPFGRGAGGEGTRGKVGPDSHPLPEGEGATQPRLAANGPLPQWQQVDDRDLPIEVRSVSDWAERFDEFSADLDIFLSVMTGIGVTIAVLSIVNTMLMSVSERIIEFGILRANGWSKGNIARLITFESAVLGIAGGVCGSALGWIGTQIINYRWSDRVELYASPGLLLFGLAFSTLLGVLGGLYPAIWATRMMPMDAIRRG